MSNFAVVFSATGTRVLKNVNPQHFAGIAGVVFNPDLSAVKGLPPHEWQLQGSRIVPGTTKSDPEYTITEHVIVPSGSYQVRQALLMLGISLAVAILFKVI